MIEATDQLVQFLAFTLDGGLFAIDIERTREVLAFTTATRIPRTPAFMRGVINLRGHVVPVIDLRLKLGLSATERSIDTCVVILEVEIEGRPTLLGVLADSVKEVIDLRPGQFAPAPKIGTRIDTDFIRGIGRRDEQFVMVLDIDRVLTAAELNAATGGQAGLGQEGSAALAEPTSAQQGAQV